MTLRTPTAEGARVLAHVHGLRDEFVDFLTGLCEVESPTDHPETQRSVHSLLVPAFDDLEYEVRTIRGRVSGDHILATPRNRPRGRPIQLLVGHSDTVWPLGTLARMPIQAVNGRLSGPGTLDMKGGLTQILFALRTLRDLGQTPDVTPIVFINADEEVGSPDSRPYVRRLARVANRALVVEPALGTEGRIKTARKGVGQFEIVVHGKASHAGLDPDAGVSAILEMTTVVQTLHAMNDRARGTAVNVGVVEGGTRPNVVAATAKALVDVRVSTIADGDDLEARIRAIEPSTSGIRIEVSGGISIKPLERTDRNRKLWSQALQCGRDLGFDLEDATAGGGSDGNTTSLYTATLDGLGCVGDGAHADHEHILIDRTLDRCALLARLLMIPPGSSTGQS